jgi:Xaa-Pro dipeptidase
LEHRIKNIFNSIKTKPDIIIIKNSGESIVDNNFFYFTGLEKGLFEGCSAILFPDGKMDLLVTELESETASKINANIKIYKNKDDYNTLLKVSTNSAKKIGLNFNGITYRNVLNFYELFPNTDFIDISNNISKIRTIKDNYEIDLIKKAVSISDHVKEKIPDLIHEGMHEYELAAEINYLIQKKGADKEAFDTISSFGKNTAEPHYSHGETNLKYGDFILCDFGARYKRYNSDITRIFILGKPNEKQKAMHEKVLEAQKLAFDYIKQGVKGCDVHKEVESFINKSEFKGLFIHSTGHSLGLEVHDGGVSLGPESNIMLEENMVLTVEPGIYIPGFGGVRIEDNILVKKDGVELLSKSSRELIDVS